MAVPDATPTLVPAFPAALTPIVPVALVTATPGITSRVLPVLKTRYILTATLARQGTAAQTPGEVPLRPRPRPVPAVQPPEPVTKLRHIPTATPVPADISPQAVRPPKPKQRQPLKSVLVVLLPAPATSAEPKSEAILITLSTQLTSPVAKKQAHRQSIKHTGAAMLIATLTGIFAPALTDSSLNIALEP